jgi:hypothetical protein
MRVTKFDLIMNELESFSDNLSFNKSPNYYELLSLYDQYSPMAYGVILQIIPQERLAQEIMVEVFSTLSVSECKNSVVSSAVFILRKARNRAIEFKNSYASGNSLMPEVKQNTESELTTKIFDLSFRQGHSPETVALALNVPKSKVLKGIYEYFKSFRQP